MKIYLDNCCYNRPYDSQEQMRIQLESEAKLFIQDLIRKGKLELVSSFVLQYEEQQNPFVMRRKEILSFIDEYTSFYVSGKGYDDIKNTAENIMSTGIKYKDAYHVACSIIAGCEYFITTDKRLLNYNSKEIKLVNPIDFVRIWEDEKYGSK